MPRHRIAILVGSLRKGSVNRQMARAMCALASERLDCRFIEIGDLPLYDEDLDQSPPESWARFRQEVAAAEGVLFVTPEYNRSIPGALKNAIDVGSRPYGKSAWAKKPAGVVTCSPGGIGGFGANHALRQACVFLDMPVMQQPEAYLGHVTADKFAADGTIADEGLAKVAANFVRSFGDWVAIIHGGRDAPAGDPTQEKATASYGT